MKILQLCNKPPYPPVEGGSIAMNAITQGLLNSGHVVKILAVNSFKFPENVSAIPEIYKEKTSYQSVFINLKINPIKAFFNLFSKKSFHVQRYYTNSFRKALIAVLSSETFDIIHFESIFLGCYIDLIRQYSKAKIVVRTHNVEHLIWERLAANSSSFLKRKYLNHLARTLKLFELSLLNKADGVMTISKIDLHYFEKNGITKPIINLPFGVNMVDDDIITKDHSHHEMSLFFIGSLNWQPNIEGVEWFIENVWHNEMLDLPNIRFYIAGRHIPKSFQKYESERTHIVGEVENALQFMNEHSIMIVPLFSGSGIRIKIIEGLMAGKAIISTSIGAEGINCTHGENILIADSPEEFAKAINALFNNAALFEKISSNAPYLIEKEHNNELIIPQMIEFYNSI